VIAATRRCSRRAIIIPIALTRDRLAYLVRHGAVHNPRGVRYGRLPGFSLSSEGRAQIQRAAEVLATQLSGSVRVVASPLERAVESASIIAEVLGSEPVQTDVRLIEARSTFDGLRYRRDAIAHLRRWISADERDEAPSEIAARMREAILELVGDRPLVIVSHQLPIQYLRMSIEQPERALRPWRRRPSCETASITALRVSVDSVPRIQVDSGFAARDK
jgi:broad specificity phosphatase PhoE